MQNGFFCMQKQQIKKYTIKNLGKFWKLDFCKSGFDLDLNYFTKIDSF